MDAEFQRALAGITLAPYIVKGSALIGIKRRGGSNMFRHQMSTLSILLDYKFIDPILLKAAVIHDLFEDASTMPGVTEDEITNLDTDGPEVFKLVMEVTIRTENGVTEPKTTYLRRVMLQGTTRARVLKLADRISNLTALGFVNDQEFVRRYVDQTREYILPYAKAINADMHKELSDLVDSRSRKPV